MDTIIGHFFFKLRSHSATAFFKIVTTLGDLKTIAVLAIVAAVMLLYTRNYRYLKALIASLAVSETVTYLAKNLFHRARPLNALITETDYSFPSGHATIAVAFYGLVAVMLMKKQISKKLRIAIAIAAIAIILLIGISRLYLGVHYFTDIVAGYIVGAMGLLIGIALL